MIRKIWWQAPLVIGGSLAIGAGIFCGAVFMQKADPYRYYYKQPTQEGTSAIMQAYMSAIVNGSKLLVLPGYTHTQPLVNFLNASPKSNEPMYKQANKAGYILLDDVYGMPILNEDGTFANTVQPLYTTQTASAMFRTDLGSFITGIAAAQLLNGNRKYFGEDLTWATYGGDTFSSVTGYMGGLQRGIQWYNENVIRDESKYIKQVFLGSDYNNNFTGSFEATAGNGLIRDFLAKNVDLLVPVAGTQTTYAVRLINQYQKRTVVLGVDTVAEDDTSANLPLLDGAHVGNGKVIQFSSVKGLDTIGAKIMDNINNGIKLIMDDVGGLGAVSVGTPNNGGVGVSENGKKYFVDAMKAYLEITGQRKDTLTYEDGVKLLEKEFVKLDNPENKHYKIPNWSGDIGALSYTNLANKAYYMMPWEYKQLEEWVKAHYPNTVDTTLASAKAWLQAHKTEVTARENFSLKQQLTKQAWEADNGLIRVIPNSPMVPLLDKSFAQTAYMGVVKYWLEQGVSAPDPTQK